MLRWNPQTKCIALVVFTGLVVSWVRQGLEHHWKWFASWEDFLPLLVHLHAGPSVPSRIRWGRDHSNTPIFCRLGVRRRLRPVNLLCRHDGTSQRNIYCDHLALGTP